MNEKTRDYYLTHPDEYWKDNPDKKLLGDKMTEIYQRTEDKMQLFKDAVSWVKTKPFLMKPEEINGPEALKRVVRLYLIELAYNELHKAE